MNLYVGANTHLIELENLAIQPDGAKVNNATVTADVREAETGERPTGLSSEISLSADANEDGRYEGTLDASVELEVHREYEVTITVDAGLEEAEWTETINATRRSF